MNQQEGQSSSCSRRQEQPQTGRPEVALIQKGGLAPKQGRAQTAQKMLCLRFQRLFGGVGSVVLDIEDGSLEVGVLGVIDFDDAFIGASYHKIQVLSAVE